MEDQTQIKEDEKDTANNNDKERGTVSADDMAKKAQRRNTKPKKRFLRHGVEKG